MKEQGQETMLSFSEGGLLLVVLCALLFDLEDTLLKPHSEGGERGRGRRGGGRGGDQGRGARERTTTRARHTTPV